LANVVESYYLETRDGLFFAVKGLEHPADRLISVVRYAPNPKGQREKGGIRYRRLYHFEEQEQLLRSSYPQYLAYDPIFHTTLQSVPQSQIRHVYDPSLRLKELAENPAAEGIEADAVAFAALLQKEAGVSGSALGVTGSILIGLHLNSSDLDLCVFGERSGYRVCEALRRLRNSPDDSGVCRFDEQGIEELYRQRVTDTRMPFNEFARLEREKICQGNFRGRPYFIRFIKEAHEAESKYGDIQYQALGRATITGTVVGNLEAIFTPCRYGVAGVCIMEGLPAQISEVVSFRGRFCEQARTGDLIMASGSVESLESIGGEVRYRLLLGNSPDDTLVTIMRKEPCLHS
jgi:uncharacterized protein